MLINHVTNEIYPLFVTIKICVRESMIDFKNDIL